MLFRSGDLLFAVANAGRWLKLDAEEALRLANGRFQSRFQSMERLCRERGLEFAGLTLDEARTAVAARLQEERGLYNALMAHALTLAQSGLNDIAPTQTVSIQGTSAFLDGLSTRDERVTLETIGALFRMIEEKHRLLELLTRYMDTDGLTIVIGSEHAQTDMHPFSLVASTFHDGSTSATVGVIGPTRMRYHRNISVVDSLSKAVSRVL